MSNPEYIRIQGEINRLKNELKKNGLPEQMRELFKQCRPYPQWVKNFGYPMHPLLTSIEQVDYETVAFDFKQSRYLLHFHHKTSSWDSAIQVGNLRIEMNRESVLESTFFGEIGEYGESWRYSDSEVYKPGPWSQDLSRFKTESNQLIEAFRAQQDAAQKRDPARLKAMREKFNIPESPPSKGQDLKTLVGQLTLRLFRR